MKEVIVILVLVATLMLLAVASMSNTENRFKEVCDKTNGTTIWDGRQYQCIGTIPVQMQSK